MFNGCHTYMVRSIGCNSSLGVAECSFQYKLVVVHYQNQKQGLRVENSRDVRGGSPWRINVIPYSLLWIQRLRLHDYFTEYDRMTSN